MKVPDTVEELLAMQVPLEDLHKTSDTMKLILKYGKHLNRLHDLIIMEAPVSLIESENMLCNALYDVVFCQRREVVNEIMKMKHKKMITEEQAGDVYRACMVISHLYGDSE